MSDSEYIGGYLELESPDMFKWYVNVKYVHMYETVEEALKAYCAAPYESLNSVRNRITLMTQHVVPPSSI